MIPVIQSQILFCKRFLSTFGLWNSRLMKIVNSNLLVKLFEILLFLLFSFFNGSLILFLSIFSLIEINERFYNQMTDIWIFMAFAFFWNIKCVFIVLKDAFFILAFIKWVVGFSWVFYDCWVFSFYFLACWLGPLSRM